MSTISLALPLVLFIITINNIINNNNNFNFISFAVAEEPFESYPHIRCEACLGIAHHLGKKMNDSVKVKTTIQASHRLGADNTPRREDYETSELRAVEVMENLCTGLHNVYLLRIDVNTSRRFFSNDRELKRAPFYGAADKEVLGAPSRKLEAYCSLLVDEHDEAFTDAILKEKTLEGLQYRLCSLSLKLCAGTPPVPLANTTTNNNNNTEDSSSSLTQQQQELSPKQQKQFAAVAKKLQKSLATEAQRRAKYIKVRDARRRRRAEAKKKKEEEEARRKALEEQNNATNSSDSDSQGGDGNSDDNNNENNNNNNENNNNKNNNKNDNNPTEAEGNAEL